MPSSPHAIKRYHHGAPGRPIVVGKTKTNLASYAEGQRCAEPDCHTLLSRYNSTTRCAQHDSS
jgi:hypothetical protein